MDNLSTAVTTISRLVPEGKKGKPVLVSSLFGIFGLLNEMLHCAGQPLFQDITQLIFADAPFCIHDLCYYAACLAVLPKKGDLTKGLNNLAPFLTSGLLQALPLVVVAQCVPGKSVTGNLFEYRCSNLFEVTASVPINYHP